MDKLGIGILGILGWLHSVCILTKVYQSAKEERF